MRSSRVWHQKPSCRSQWANNRELSTTRWLILNSKELCREKKKALSYSIIGSCWHPTLIIMILIILKSNKASYAYLLVWLRLFGLRRSSQAFSESSHLERFGNGFGGFCRIWLPRCKPPKDWPCSNSTFSACAIQHLLFKTKIITKKCYGTANVERRPSSDWSPPSAISGFQTKLPKNIIRCILIFLAQKKMLRFPFFTLCLVTKMTHRAFQFYRSTGVLPLEYSVICCVLLLYAKDFLTFFLSCYVVRSCAGRSWFLINSKWNTGGIKFKLMQKVRHVLTNDWNKVSQNFTEDVSWKLQWPFYKNNAVDNGKFATICNRAS